MLCKNVPEKNITFEKEVIIKYNGTQIMQRNKMNAAKYKPLEIIGGFYRKYNPPKTDQAIKIIFNHNNQRHQRSIFNAE